MALQIANPVVVMKVERLARATGLSKTAVVERAIDRLAAETQSAAVPGRMTALLAQIDRVPDRADAFDPLACGRSWFADMIVADTSAIVALVFGEPGREVIAQAIQQADKALISTVSVLRRLPLLYKGGDFAQTAVVSALPVPEAG